MAIPSSDEIIIKRVKKVQHGGHGGAWKIAYADFVTAMMAFFLLMWLINAATEDTKKGIAEYFTTTIVTFKDSGGAQGMMEGQNQQSPNNTSIEQDPIDDMEYNTLNDTTPKNVIKTIVDAQLLSTENTAREIIAQDPSTDSNTTNSTNNKLNIDQSQKTDSNNLKKQKEKNTNQSEKKDEQINQEQKTEQQIKKFEEIIAQIKEAFNSIKELEIFKNNLILELTDQGLKIQIMDDDKHEMFKTGDPTPIPQTQLLLNALGKIIVKLPNKINITGHTDSKPYANQKGYSNWELSSDRAHATRRILEKANVNNNQFLDIVGKADREPFNKNNPEASENRRISIMLLYLDSEKNEQ